MEAQTCYIFKANTEPPAKRRKVTINNLDTTFGLRKRAYTTLWARQEQQTHDVIRETNTRTLEEILSFVDITANTLNNSHRSSFQKVPTALITTGAGSISHDGLFELLDEAITARGDDQIFIPIQATDAPNLKTLLKNINVKGCKSGQQQSLHDDVGEGEDGEKMVGVTMTSTTKRSDAKGPKLLNYDLEILRRECASDGGYGDGRRKRVVLALRDSEAFDAAVLTDLFLVLHSWLDRLPVTLLIGIATSIDIFHERLPRAALRCLSGQAFDVTKSEDVIERVFECSAANEDAVLRIGAGLSDAILQRQRDHVQSVEAFNSALKYAYMCHFHGNPLSIFLVEDISYPQLNHDHFEALRNLPSFRTHAESLLDAKQIHHVRQLLQSDEVLFHDATEAIKAGRVQVVWLLGAIRIIQSTRIVLSTKNPTLFSYLYIEALAGNLLGSSTLRELLLLLKKADSDMISAILPSIIDTLITMPARDIAISPDDFQDIANELETLTANVDPAELPLKSQMNHDFLGKVATTGRKPVQQDEIEVAYSELLSRLHGLLARYFEMVLVSVESIFLHEILFYDVKGAHRDVFTPKVRFAVERALGAPCDYLGCGCCSSKDALTPTQPPTAILYQLYLEAGLQINTFDLYTAFHAIMSSDTAPEVLEDETIMTLFYRALAELKWVGLVRQSRRKADCVLKVGWGGL